MLSVTTGVWAGGRETCGHEREQEPDGKADVMKSPEEAHTCGCFAVNPAVWGTHDHQETFALSLTSLNPPPANNNRLALLI